jgi:hypothetical protein
MAKMSAIVSVMITSITMNMEMIAPIVYRVLPCHARC